MRFPFTELILTLVISFPAEEQYHEVSLKQLRQFTLHELQTATDNFSSREVLTRCGFNKVYKGRLGNGVVVAVKRLAGK